MCDTALFQDTRVEPFVNRASNDAVTYPLVQYAPEMVVVDGIKITLNIDFQNPATSESHHLLPQSLQHLMGGSPWAKPVGAVKKVLLINGFDHHGNRALQHFILKGGHAKGTYGSPLLFGHIRPPDWGRDVGASFQAVHQRRQSGIKGLGIGSRRLSIHAWGAIFPRATKRLAEEGHVNVMRQCGENPLWRFPGQSRYPVELR
jgi:hypothetical protein